MKPQLFGISLHTKRFFSAVVLSRLSGFFRDLAMAFAFGDSPSVAAFFVAFRFANLLRRLLGEGPFQSAFIPHFEELKICSMQRALGFFRKLSFSAAIFLLIVTAAVETAIVLLLSFNVFSPGAGEIAYLSAWLFPAIVFICLYGLNLSFLQCFDVFFTPNLGPLVCNLFWIAGAIFLKDVPAQKALVLLSQFVVLGFAGQWLLTLPQTLKRMSKNAAGSLNTGLGKDVKSLFKTFSISAIGVGALQVNAFIDSLFARSANLRGPAYLWYSIRLEQLALAVFGFACIQTIVPKLSRAVKAGDMQTAHALFELSYRRILWIMLFCSFAIFSVGPAAVNLLYGRGDFSSPAIAGTSLCLWGYGLGLAPTAMAVLFSALFYACKNFRLPMLFSVFSVILNIGLNAVFVFIFKMGAESIALATSLSAFFNFYLLQKNAQNIGFKSSLSLFKIFRTVAVFAASFSAAFAADWFLLDKNVSQLFLSLFSQKMPAFSRLFSQQMLEFALLCLCFGSGFVFCISLPAIARNFWFFWQKKFGKKEI